MPSKKQRARVKKQNKPIKIKSTQTELTRMKQLEKKVKKNKIATNNYCYHKNNTVTSADRALL